MKPTRQSSAPRIIRLAHPMAFAAFLRHIGAPVERHFRRQGLPVYCEDPNAFVPLRKAWAFFEATARSEDPLLGWHAGRFAGENCLNTSLLAKLERAPTLLLALRRFIQLVSSEASHLQYEIRERRDDILFVTHYPDLKGEPGYTSSQAYQIGVLVDVVRHFAGENWVPSEIGIEYPVVPAIAKELFPGSRIRPRQKFGYLAIPRSCLHLSAKRHLFQDGENRSVTQAGRLDYADTLRELLKPYLPEGYPDAALAASLIDSSVRTMARRLSDCGLTYQAIVDEVRFTEAKKLLENSNTPIIDVASAVGFEDAAHFSRMFRRVGGVSPREFRRDRG